MRKFFILAMLVVSTIVGAQSKLLQGMYVGDPYTNMALIDSIKYEGSRLTFYRGGVSVLVYGGIRDHGGLAGLLDDDHSIYYTSARLTAWVGSGNITTLGTVVAADISMDYLSAPSGNFSMNLAQKQIKYIWTNPSTADGAFELQITGTFTGDLMHLHQSTGNPGPGTHLMHLEADDPDVTGLYLTGFDTAIHVPVALVHLGGDLNVSGTLANTELQAATSGVSDNVSDITISLTQFADTLGKENVISYGAVHGSGSDVTAFQAAMDAAWREGGSYGDEKIMLVPAGVWHIDAPIIVRSRVTVEIADNATFYVPSGYTESVWLFADGTNETDVTINGGYYQEIAPHEYNWSWVKIDKSDGNYVMFCTIKNATVRYASAVIDVSLTGSDSWANGNTFSDIIMWQPRSGIKVRADRGNNNQFDGNKFFNINIQTGSSTMFGIDSLSGYDNTFSNITFWDFDNAEAGRKAFVFWEDAWYNQISNSMLSPGISDSWDDFGVDNNIWGFDNKYTEIRGGMIIDDDASNRKDSVSKLIIIGNGDAGITGAPAGDAGIRIKSYYTGYSSASYNSMQSPNGSVRFIGQNEATNNNSSTAAIDVHGNSPSVDYIRAISLDGSDAGDATFSRAVILTPASSATATEGSIYYDAEDNTFYGRDNDSWEDFTGGGGSDTGDSIYQLWQEVFVDTIPIGDVTRLLIDSTLKWSWNLTDSAQFHTNRWVAWFYHAGPDTLAIEGVRAGTQGSAPNFEWNIAYNDSLSFTGDYTDLWNTSLVVTGTDATTIGEIDTSPNNPSIPPGNWVMLRFDDDTAWPSYGCSFNIYGYEY